MSDKYKLAEFAKSFENLKNIILESKTPIIRDATIKRYELCYELCYELAWKSVQERLRTHPNQIYFIFSIMICLIYNGSV